MHAAVRLPPSRRRTVGRRALSAALLLALLATAACDDRLGAAASARAWPASTGLTWQVQFTGDPDLAVDADVFEFDVITAPAQAVEQLRARGRRLICHVNAGVYQDFQPDADRFPTEVLGAQAGSAGERWLDIHQWDILKPIMLDRLRLCRGKGFEAVDLDNVDAYTAASGFPLTFDDQLRYNRRLAALARSVGLSPGLHNDLDQIMALEPDFDFAVNEGCYQLGECRRLLPFVEAGKPVFHLEYDAAVEEFCVTSRGYGFSSIQKDRDLGAWRVPCLL